jgi:hypothetical protein
MNTCQEFNVPNNPFIIMAVAELAPEVFGTEQPSKQPSVYSIACTSLIIKMFNGKTHQTEDLKN